MPKMNRMRAENPMIAKKIFCAAAMFLAVVATSRAEDALSADCVPIRKKPTANTQSASARNDEPALASTIIAIAAQR